MKTALAGKLVLGILAAAGSSSSAQQGIKRVLHYTKIVGYKPSGAQTGCTKALNNLAAQHGFSVTHSPEPAEILKLGQYDIVIFDNNVSNGGGQTILPSTQHQEALVEYLEGGGLWLGFGGVADYDGQGWDWYHKTLFSGLYFTGRSGARTFTLETDPDLDRDPALRAMWQAAGFESTVTFDSSLLYQFKTGADIRKDPGVRVLQKLIKTDEYYDDHVLTWTKAIGQGRMLYTALGNRERDFSQNDRWLERATWEWMKYLDGQYGRAVSIRHEDGRLESLGRMPSENLRALVYAVNGRLVATRFGSLSDGFDASRKARPGVNFAIIESLPGVTAKKVVNP